MIDAALWQGRTLVSVVDDDASVREALPELLEVCGYEARAFPSAEDFLASGAVRETRCLILDVAMPGMSGPELQQALSNRGERVPLIFITANRDEDERARLLAEGAVECLFKPFSDAALLRALEKALLPR